MMDDGMLSAVTMPHVDRGGSGDGGRCGVVGDSCRRRCCTDRDDGRRRGCSSVLCGSVCTRTMLIVVNLTFFLAGWVMCGVGLWVHIFRESLLIGVLLEDNPTAPVLVIDRVPITFIACGTVIVVIGFLGCCGACTESVCFLGFYAVLLLLWFIAQVAVITLAFMFHQQIRSSLLDSMQYQVHYEYNITGTFTDPTDTLTYRVTSSWDLLQTKLTCCGAAGPQDYYYSLWFNHTHHTQGGFVPASCCPALDEPDVTHCQIVAVEYVNPFYDNGKKEAKGCHAAIMDLLYELMPLAFVFLALDLVQLTNIVYACVLINLVRRKQVDYSWCEDDDID